MIEDKDRTEKMFYKLKNAQDSSETQSLSQEIQELAFS